MRLLHQHDKPVLVPAAILIFDYGHFYASFLLSCLLGVADFYPVVDAISLTAFAKIEYFQQ